MKNPIARCRMKFPPFRLDLPKFRRRDLTARHLRGLAKVAIPPREILARQVSSPLNTSAQRVAANAPRIAVVDDVWACAALAYETRVCAETPNAQKKIHRRMDRSVQIMRYRPLIATPCITTPHRLGTVGGVIIAATRFRSTPRLW